VPFLALGILSFYFQHQLAILIPPGLKDAFHGEGIVEGLRLFRQERKTEVDRLPPSAAESTEDISLLDDSDYRYTNEDEESNTTQVEKSSTTNEHAHESDAEEEQMMEEAESESFTREDGESAEEEEVEEKKGQEGQEETEEERVKWERREEFKRFSLERAEAKRLQKQLKQNQTAQEGDNNIDTQKLLVEIEREALRRGGGDVVRSKTYPEVLTCMKDRMRLSQDAQKTLVMLMEEEIENVKEIPRAHKSCSLRIEFKEDDPKVRPRVAIWKPFAGTSAAVRLKDQGWAEIAAFHANTIMGFHTAPVAVGRSLDLKMLMARGVYVEHEECSRYLETIAFDDPTPPYGDEEDVGKGKKKTTTTKEGKTRIGNNNSKNTTRRVRGALIEWFPSLVSIFREKEIGTGKRQLMTEAKEFFLGRRDSQHPREDKAYREIFLQTIFDFVVDNEDRRGNVLNWFATCIPRKKGEKRGMMIHGRRTVMKEGKKIEKASDYEMSPIWDDQCRLVSVDNGLAFRQLDGQGFWSDLENYKAWHRFVDVYSVFADPAATVSRLSKSLRCDPLDAVSLRFSQHADLKRIVAKMSFIKESFERSVAEQRELARLAALATPTPIPPPVRTPIPRLKTEEEERIRKEKKAKEKKKKQKRKETERA